MDNNYFTNEQEQYDNSTDPEYAPFSYIDTETRSMQFGPGPGQGPGRPPGPGPGQGPGRPPGPGPGPIPPQPLAPPPNFIPEIPGDTGGPETFRSGGQTGSRNLRFCLNRNTFMWLLNGNRFWFYPTFIGANHVEGFRWVRNFWVYERINLRLIFFFLCF